jgi:toxin ParE1/3/4
LPQLPIIWRPEARNDLATIIGYIADRDPAAARRMKTLIESAVLPLPAHPMLFRTGRVTGTRELVAHPNYIIIYRVASDRIEIVAIVHARQQYP